MLLLTVAWPAILAFAEESAALEGHPFRGREVFDAKRCTECHSVWGHGGTLGPDMSIAVAGKSWQELVGDFWNHTPRMIDGMVEQGYPWPTLTRDEMADLLSYLYYLRLFDEPGSETAGETAYARLQCASCHSLGGRGESAGGPLDRFSAYPSPVVLAQSMWNAGPAMQQTQIGYGIPIPSFTGNEIADIQAYIRARGLRPGRESELLPLPEPSRGGEVFRAKRCGVCHTAGAEGPDLTISAHRMTASEISGVLWNHSYAMNDRMKARGIPFPSFQGGEMADLISYLFFLGYSGERGDQARGAEVFEQMRCGGCHQGSEMTGPDLSQAASVTDPIGLSAAMWNHAPEMHELMAEQDVPWPKFDPGQMRDLAAYLWSLAPPDR